MIGYDLHWYTKQLELGLLIPQQQKPLKLRKTAVKSPEIAIEVAQENSSQLPHIIEQENSAL
jgi:hypothetical protein